MQNNLFLRSIRLSDELPKGSYLNQVAAIRHLKRMGELNFQKPVTFQVGENGVGKSTLIEGIAVAMGFNPEGGSINFSFSTEDSHSELYRFLTVSKGTKRRKDGYFLRAESYYNVASNIDQMDRQLLSIPDVPKLIDSYGGTSLHKQSHGESFLSLIEHRFGGNGIYILDEPEAALSPMRMMELICHIHDLVEKDSQFIISTHSPILMAYPDAEVLQISEKGIESVSYEDTEHFRLTRQFLNAPEKMLQYLLEK